MTAFGMVRADRTKSALYMRGTDSPHHLHVTELGEPQYVGIAFHAGSMDDLEKLSRVDGASPIESIDEPGGGKRVRLTDPDGFQVEVVYGMQQLPKIPVVRPAVNSGEDKTRRRNTLYRVERGPSHIKRIGHFVVMSPNFEKMLLLQRDLGFSVSDELRRAEDNIVGLFHPDRGDVMSIHQVLLHPRRQTASTTVSRPPISRSRSHDHMKEKVRPFWALDAIARQPGVRLGGDTWAACTSIGRYRRLEPSVPKNVPARLR